MLRLQVALLGFLCLSITGCKGKNDVGILDGSSFNGPGSPTIPNVPTNGTPTNPNNPNNPNTGGNLGLPVLPTGFSFPSALFGGPFAVGGVLSPIAIQNFIAQPPAKLAISGYPLRDLGDVRVGDVVETAFAIANFGLGPVTNLVVEMEPSSSEFSVSHNCQGNVIDGRGGCIATVTFRPNQVGEKSIHVKASGMDNNRSVAVEALREIQAFATESPIRLGAGYKHSCGINGVGALFCWGDNGKGQLGIGTKGGFRKTPIQANNISSGATQVDGGDEHTCAIVNGGLKCTGKNSNGQLGVGDRDHRDDFTDVSNMGSDLSSVATGKHHTCAVKDGNVYCWGYGHFGQLGQGNRDRSTTAKIVPGVPNNAVQVAAGRLHSCALFENGSVYCWGHNAQGQLGIGSITGDKKSAQLVPNTGFISQIAAGDNQTCAVRRNGVLICWGEGLFFALGNDSYANKPGRIRVHMEGDKLVKQVSIGRSHACARMEDNTLQCWGENFKGQVGNNSRSLVATPQTINISNVSTIALKDENSLAVSGEEVKVWGHGYRGRLGLGPDSTHADVLGPVTNDF